MLALSLLLLMLFKGLRILLLALFTAAAPLALALNYASEFIDASVLLGSAAAIAGSSSACLWVSSLQGPLIDVRASLATTSG